MTYKFTKSSENVLNIANDLAQDMGHNYIGTEHILYGLVLESSGVASKVLENQGIVSELVLERIESLIGLNDETNSQILGSTPRSKKILENALSEAKKLGSDYIGTEHILIGIMKEEDSIAVRIILDLGGRIEDIYNEIVKVLNDYEKLMNSNYKIQNGSYNATVTLNQFGIDLSKQALEGKLDPVIGRENQTERVIEILSRRTKNNPCLIGEPGVGKTAVIEGLAQKIILGAVPESLKNKRVVVLDISSMVAGAKYRGDFEDRIKKALRGSKER